ncbi:MAG: mechanosensitive ion channel family protein [Anaerolineae bacterium]|nr:mechanosensitive ion channel family protein [Anaerolineae bacterium]NUQ07009.1 mechanosensitive ion channel family protein [Anaerolineae bacterium]
MFNALDDFRVLLARLLLVIVVFGVAWLLRNAVAWLLSRPLKLMLSRARASADIETVIRSIVLLPVRYLLLALAIDLAARILELDPPWIGFALSVGRTVVIVALAIFIFRLINTFIISTRSLYLFAGITLDAALLPFIRTGVTIVVIAIALVIVLQVWGYDVTGLVAGLGLGGLAFSLAAQDLLSNLFGFAAVVSDRPFVVGEYIKTPDVEGTVEHVGVRSTRIRQLDQAIVTVPNSKLAAGTILNWSRLAKRRVDFLLGVEYATSADQMQALLIALREMLQQHPKVEKDSVVVYFTEFADSSLNILIRCFITLSEWAAFTAEKEQVLLEVMRILERMKISVAFPSQTVYYQPVDDLPGLPPALRHSLPPTGSPPPSLPEER